MPSIHDIAKSGAWDYKDFIVPAAVAIPLALEGAILAKNIYQNPQFIKEKFLSLKNKVIESFTIQKDEKKSEAIKRIVKNCFILLSCLSLMAAAVYFSAILLPGAFAITTAISSVFLIGKLFVNFKEYKKQIVEAFSIKDGEDPEEARKRIRKNKLKALAIAVVAIATVAIAAYILMPMFAGGFCFSVSLPLQTKGVVFAEYAAVGVLHGALAYRQWKKGNKSGALFHIFAAALSFAFPGYYWNHEMRLHHSFYGLLLMAAPSRSLKFFGSLVTFDSLLYMISPWRGYSAVNQWGYQLDYQYDFINSVVDNCALFAGAYAGANILENINNSFKKEKKKISQAPKPETPPVLGKPVKSARKKKAAKIKTMVPVVQKNTTKQTTVQSKTMVPAVQESTVQENTAASEALYLKLWNQSRTWLPSTETVKKAAFALYKGASLPFSSCLRKSV